MLPQPSPAAKRPSRLALSNPAPNLPDPGVDNRTIEVGLPLYHGAQLAVDTTLVSPVGCDGAARLRSDTTPGAALAEAARRKRHQVYPELQHAARCRLIVVGLETGVGRFIRRLAAARARGVPLTGNRGRKKRAREKKNYT